MITMVSFDEFMPDLETELKACPVPIIERRLREAIIEACEDANIWTVHLDEIQVIAGQVVYELPVQADTAIHSIVAVSNNGRQLYTNAGDFYVDERGFLVLDSKPKFDSDPIDLSNPDAKRRKGLVIVATLKPTRDALTVGTYLFNQYHKLFINGALSKAFEMKNRVWSDPNAGVFHRNIFEEEVADAKRAIDRGFVTGSQSLTARPFAASSQRRGFGSYRNF